MVVKMELINTVTNLVFAMLFISPAALGDHFTETASKPTMLCLAKTDYLGVVNATECAVQCLGKSRSVAKTFCAAFKYDDSLKKCTTCIYCGNIPDVVAIPTSTPSTDFTHFMYYPDYLKTLNKDVLLYYDFESIPSGASPIGTPTFVGGKHNNGIFWPNLDWETGHGLVLNGPHTACMLDLAQCESGLSLAFWIKMENLPNGYPSTFRSTAMSIGCTSTGTTTPNSPRKDCWFRFINIARNMDYEVVTTTIGFTLNVWWHVMMTYKHGHGLDLYLNGCHYGSVLDAQATGYTPPGAAVTPLNVTFSCQYRTTGLKVCAREILDDFYMWTDYKPALFAYQMYHMYP